MKIESGTKGKEPKKKLKAEQKGKDLNLIYSVTHVLMEFLEKYRGESDSYFKSKIELKAKKVEEL